MPVIKKVCLAIASLAVAVVLAEGALQVAYRVGQGRWLWQGDAFRVGYTQPVRDRRQYALRPNWTDQKAGITINRLGFRGAPLVPGTRVIVALGDSVPFGVGVRDAETYPAQLDALLQAAGSSIRVLNAGVPSYNLRQSFDRLRLDVLPRYPAPVLMSVQAANDIALLTHYRERFTPDVTWANARWQRTWGRPWIARSAIAGYLERAFIAPAPRETERHEPFPKDLMLQNFRQVLEEGLRSCREQRIPVVLMPIDPFYYQTKNGGWNERLSRWKSKENQSYVTLWGASINTLNDLLAEKGQVGDRVFFLDTRRLLDDQDREEMYMDLLHYSPKGNALVARALLDVIVRHGLLESEAGSRIFVLGCSQCNSTNHPFFGAGIRGDLRGGEVRDGDAGPLGEPRSGGG